MHPTGLFIETLVNEKLPPGHGAVASDLLADHMNFAPKIKRGMRVDQKSVLPDAVCSGAMAIPLEPLGSANGATSKSTRAAT